MGEALGDRVDVTKEDPRWVAHPNLEGTIAEPIVDDSSKGAIRPHCLQAPLELGMREIVEGTRHVEGDRIAVMPDNQRSVDKVPEFCEVAGRPPRSPVRVLPSQQLRFHHRQQSGV